MILIRPICASDRSSMPSNMLIGGFEMSQSSPWFIWALMSAVFAALTAILAKIGVQGVDPDLATLLRTVVVIMALSALVVATGKWRSPFELSVRTLLFLALSGLATGASWICY